MDSRRRVGWLYSSYLQIVSPKTGLQNLLYLESFDYIALTLSLSLPPSLENDLSLYEIWKCKPGLVSSTNVQTYKIPE